MDTKELETSLEQAKARVRYYEAQLYMAKQKQIDFFPPGDDSRAKKRITLEDTVWLNVL
jgi:hypothetical protein